MATPDLPDGPVPISTGTVELVRDHRDPTGVMVLVNGVESSHLDLVDPARLEFEYMQQMMAVLSLAGAQPEPEPIHAIHLGAAACALARAVEARRPGSRQLAVDVDAELARLVRTWFDLPRAPRLRLRIEDARRSLETARPASQDAVVRDVFADRAVPAHVRTVEFVALASRALRPDGLYLSNSADYPPLHTTRREAATAREVFAHVAVILEPGVLRGRRYGNVVLVGAHRPLPLAALTRALRSLPIPVALVTDDDLTHFAGKARPFVDGAPSR